MDATVFREPSQSPGPLSVVANEKFSGPFEKRSIIRHAIGFYSNLVVGNIYNIPKGLIEESALVQLESYAQALLACVEEHPLLSATIRGSASSSPTYTRPAQLDLQNHFQCISTVAFESSLHEETSFLAEAVEELLNRPRYAFSNLASQPAWALHVLPLAAAAAHYRVFISFTCSHSHGDGMSGPAFHQTFHRALQTALPSIQKTEVKVDSLAEPLYAPSDTSANIPISWSYLLRPVLGTYLPSFISRLLGISANISGANSRTWTGSTTFIDTKTAGMQVTSSVELVDASAHTTACLLTACRKNDARMTGLLNHLIASSLKEAFAEYGKEATHFVSQVPINLRKALGVSSHVIGLYAGGAYLSYDDSVIGTQVHDLDWSRVRLDSQELAHVASDLQNQPIGLLRYVSNYRTWFLGQIGKSRDCSWELSNIGNYMPPTIRTDQQHACIGVERVIFSQSATPTGYPIQFCVAGAKDGGLCISITWQAGSLGLSKDEAESQEVRDRGFIRRLSALLAARLEGFAQK